MAGAALSRSDAAAVLTALAGVWEGTGHGEFPTIESFDYRERAEFIFDDARRLVRYCFEDTIVGPGGDDLRPSHVDVGILRLTDDGDFELLSAQTGRVEVLQGAISTEAGGAGMELRLDSVVVARPVSSRTVRFTRSPRRSR